MTPPRTCTCFEHNLRKVRDWTDKASEGITEAYRRFLYLKALSGEVLTPPYWIDDAWHLHMAFPPNYNALQSELNRALVHRQGLTGEEQRRAWDRGRELWKAEVDTDPPLRIWPPRSARWRPVAGTAVLVLVLVVVGLLFWYERTHPALILPIWMGGGVLMAILFAKWTPKTISRCG